MIYAHIRQFLDQSNTPFRALHHAPTYTFNALAQPAQSELRTNNKAANGLAEAVKRLAEAESLLRKKLEKEFCSDAPA